MKPVLLLALLCVPAFSGSEEGVLVKGAIYYDSEPTLREVQAYTILRDNESIKEMTKLGHISEPTPSARDILVYRGDHTPKDSVEFVFADDAIPTTYWTYSRFVSDRTTSTPTPSSTPSPTPSSIPSPTPSSTVSPVVSRPKQKTEGPPGGHKVWHTLPDGTRKWYYEKYRPRSKTTRGGASAANPTASEGNQ
jgi:hypothetical protein